MQRKRGKQKISKAEKPTDVQTTSITRGDAKPQSKSPLKLAVMVGVLVVVIIGMYVLIPGHYSGPRYEHTERAAEKRAQESNEKKEAERQKQAEKDREDFPNDAEYTNNTSSCDELMDEAKSILDSRMSTHEDTEFALDMLATCALKEPENGAARWNLAAALVQLSRVDEALPFIDEAITLDPSNRQYLHDAGMLFTNLGYHKEAIKCLESYLELSLQVPNWTYLLATISIQREDEWMFLYDAGRDIVNILEVLLSAYLHDGSLVRAGYLYKIVIGLKGPDNAGDLVRTYAFFSFGLGDFLTGMKYLRLHTEQQYVSQGYGDLERAYDIVSIHSLRLFTAGIDAHIVSIARNLLMSGEVTFNELLYNCELKEDVQHVNYSVSVSQNFLREILTSCLLSQGVIPHLVESGAIVHTENIFGWTPLLQIISLNNSDILFQVLKAGADMQSRTAIGLTPLHVAAIKGSSAVVLPLLQGGIKIDQMNALNQTALDLACIHRWPAKEFAKAIKLVRLPSGCPTENRFLPPLKQGLKTGGWLTPSIKLPNQLTAEVCDIDVVGYTTTSEDILLNYLALQKPVLVRNATNPKILKKLFQFWQRNKIYKQYGDLHFNEVLVPYAESFGYNKSITTLKQFLDKMTSINEEQSLVKNVFDLKPPTYIFETVPEDSSILKHFEIPLVLDSTLTEIATTKFQFYVGPTLSGAPPHFHRSAWNALIYGRKRWFLFPPQYAFYSKQHVWDWWRQYRKESTTWECVQHPGDMIILPDMWGHAVINLKESIGVASEFIYGTSEFSL